MAEIHIQKKKRPVWPWILIIAAVLIAAWLLVENTRVDEQIAGGLKDEQKEEEYNSIPKTHSSAMLNDYIRFINEEQPSGSNPNKDFINEGVKKLSMAISEIAEEKFPRNSEINSQADLIQKKSYNLRDDSKNSNEIRDIAVSTADIFGSMRKNSGKNIDSEVSAVRNSADKIVINKSVEKQQNEITDFLKQSGDVLQRLAADDKEV
ncbi:MAG: hypothetical protein EHM47_03815 [Ignavibacteriales bacterium]|nr:MAG: hypothetical protein EHM47_03815 [Ignavibacteriales bacterium]